MFDRFNIREMLIVEVGFYLSVKLSIHYKLDISVINSDWYSSNYFNIDSVLYENISYLSAK